MASNDSEQDAGVSSRFAGSATGGSSRRPVIGLTTYLERAKQGVWDVRAAFLPQQYFAAVVAAGGIAVLLPPQPGGAEAAAAVLDGLDGLILTGGMDVQPELYGAERDPRTDPARADRDDWELALYRGADERRMPVLAICRGLQLVNVARGGTLHQHLPDVLGTERYRIGGGVFATNTVEIAGQSRLSGLLGTGPVEVHSYHHQGIDRLGEGLVPVADAGDGLVQAFESAEGEGYLVGVQWHPEENAEDTRLFAGLVEEAARFAAARSGATV